MNVRSHACVITRLPVTKMKFDWENKAAVHNLAKDLNTLKAGK